MVCLATLMLCIASAAGSLQGKLANIGFVEYSAEQIDCAACEAVAQALEKAMSSGAHLGKDSRARPAKTRGTGTSGSGAVERMDTLYSTCQQIGTYVPAKLETTQTIHFLDSRDQSVKELVGLREYCEELVEAHEDAVLEVMRRAQPAETAPSTKQSSGGHLRYEIKAEMCVEAAGRCSVEALADITDGRTAEGVAKPEMHQPSMGVVDQEAIDEWHSRQAPEYEVLVRTTPPPGTGASGSGTASGAPSKWYPVGTMRGTDEDAIANAILDSKKDVLQGAYASFPFPRQSTGTVELGFRLKATAADHGSSDPAHPVRLAVRRTAKPKDEI